MAEADFEKLGVFYLGRRYDLQAGKKTDELFLYESNDLLTHAICIGMTGSGKTGLCLSLIEEAVIDGIPIMAIDPKGDIANLLLTFPNLTAADFAPWVDADEARRAGETLEEFAAQQAASWKKGLADWDQGQERIAKLKSSAEFALYTPGSTAGMPVSIVRSFDTPSADVIEDAELFNDRVAATASSLLSLLGIDADPMRSREHILLSNIMRTLWSQRQSLTLQDLIQLIQKPPINQVGALDLESFFPAKERVELSMLLNNLIAAPGFETWIQGESLDVDRLLYTAEGKPRVSIFSIAHLDDTQRMFFTSLLLNQLVSWMRAQSGTTSLRAIFYMDEIFGYFPPTANPPSKRPLLMLMKQARAFGLGLVLATQNPVDIDYKGLANAGTWFIGRLQTERDKLRVIDGLEGAAADTGSKFDRPAIDKILSQLGSRVFLMNNVHDQGPTIFQTRYTLSYLRGPLARDQIKRLTKEAKTARAAAAPDTSHADQIAMPTASATASSAVSLSKPIVSPSIPECFLPLKRSLDDGQLVYRPMLIGVGNIRFADTKAKVDSTMQYTLLAAPPSGALASIDWDKASVPKVYVEQLAKTPEPNARYVGLPAGFADEKGFSVWTKQFAQWLYNAKTLKLFQSSLTGDYSKPRESERDFRIRLAQAAREKRDQAVEELKSKFGPRRLNLEDRLAKARQALARQEAQVREQQLQSAISVGATVLGAFMSKRRVSSTSIGKAASAARTVGRAARQQQDVAHANESVETLSARLDQLDAEFTQEMQKLEGKFDPSTIALTELRIVAKKTNVSVVLLALAWAPFIEKSGQQPAPAWIL